MQRLKGYFCHSITCHHFKLNLFFLQAPLILTHPSASSFKTMSLLHLQFSSVRSPPSLPSKSSIPTACAAQSSFPSSSSPASKSSRSSSSALSSPSTKQKDHQHHNGSIFGVRSSLDTVGLTVGQVTEVNKDTFWPIVNAAGDKTVVLDMYTQWYASYFNYFIYLFIFLVIFLSLFFIYVLKMKFGVVPRG